MTYFDLLANKPSCKVVGAVDGAQVMLGAVAVCGCDEGQIRATKIAGAMKGGKQLRLAGWCWQFVCFISYSKCIWSYMCIIDIPLHTCEYLYYICLHIFS